MDDGGKRSDSTSQDGSTCRLNISRTPGRCSSSTYRNLDPDPIHTGVADIKTGYTAER